MAALADVETLTETWTPRREAWSLAGDVAGAAPDGCRDPTPRICSRTKTGRGSGGTGAPVPPPAVVPTDEEIRAELNIFEKTKRREGETERRENERVVAEAALDERIRERRVARARRMAARADALNARVSDPKLRWEM